MDALPQNLFWTFATVQVSGLLIAVMARMAENRSGWASIQCLFMASLTLVASTTLFAVVMGWTAWVFSGATLSSMVVMAVWDPGLQAAS